MGDTKPLPLNQYPFAPRRPHRLVCAYAPHGLWDAAAHRPILVFAARHREYPPLMVLSPFSTAARGDALDLYQALTLSCEIYRAPDKQKTAPRVLSPQCLPR